MNKLFSIEELGINYVAPQDIKADGFVPAFQPTPFKPIGIGLPLLVRLHTVYVGNLSNTIFNTKQSILVNSMVKDDVTYEAASRAVNQIFKPVKDRTLLYMRASNQGSEILYYTKAYDNSRLLVEVEVKADKFNQDLFNNISNGLNNASGLPIFIPYASYMLVGGQLFKIAGEFFNKIMEKVPVLNYPFAITNDIGGLINTEPGFLIGGNPDELVHFKGYDITHDVTSPGNVYLSKDGIPYQGDIPYIILSLDGNTHAAYDKFKPTMATAAIMKKYYGVSEKSNMDVLQDMVSLYNDYTYLKKTKTLATQMEGVTDESEKEKMQKLLDAYKSNITNDDIKKLLS